MKNISLIGISTLIDNLFDRFKLNGVQGVNDTYDDIQLNEETYDNPKHEKQVHKGYYMMTSGINMTDLRYMRGINLERTTCDDIATIYNLFGIEAARSSLLYETNKVYENAGNKVNYQHLALLADVMTCTGRIISIDRHGLAKLDNDPLSNASFEKVVEQLTNASVFAETEHMRGVSARIMAGLLIRGGTGICDVMLDTEMIENSEFTDDLGQKYQKTYDDIMPNELMKPNQQKQKTAGIFIPK